MAVGVPGETTGLGYGKVEFVRELLGLGGHGLQYGGAWNAPVHAIMGVDSIFLD